VDEQLEFVKQIAERLASAGIPYMMTGSMAMAVYATPRMTRDVDLVVECGPDDAPRLVRLFETDCYVDAEAVANAVSTRGMFNIIHNEWITKADFIVRKSDPYRETEFGRRRDVAAGGVRLSVVAPEDLILSKLAWARDTGSELQRRDVRELIASVRDLDWSYLERWAAHLEVSRELTEARS
jgi:hypothetical protein